MKKKPNKEIKPQIELEKRVKESEKINLNLEMENNNWTGSPSALPLFFIEDLECSNAKKLVLLVVQHNCS